MPPQLAPSPLPELPSATVLARYAAALPAVRAPTAYSFEYAYERHGSRPQARTDRVYRQADRERDEILSINGERFTSPQVRVFVGRQERYRVERIAPSPDAYGFTYVGPRRNGNHLDYVFDTTPHTPGPYVVTQVTIDGGTFLPSQVAFRTKAGNVEGTGLIGYAKADKYWMPVSATARAQVGGKLETERIAFTRYRFFARLPPETFAKARAK